MVQSPLATFLDACKQPHIKFVHHSILKKARKSRINHNKNFASTSRDSIWTRRLYLSNSSQWNLSDSHFDGGDSALRLSDAVGAELRQVQPHWLTALAACRDLQHFLLATCARTRAAGRAAESNRGVGRGGALSGLAQRFSVHLARALPPEQATKKQNEVKHMICPGKIIKKVILPQSIFQNI